MSVRWAVPSVPTRRKVVLTQRARTSVYVSGKIYTRTLKGTVEVSAIYRLL